jgi:hypothetical protein
VADWGWGGVVIRVIYFLCCLVLNSAAPVIQTAGGGGGVSVYECGLLACVYGPSIEAHV